MSTPWQFWIDRGGTFTDCIAHNPATGEVYVEKLLSSDDAPLTAIRRILKLGPSASIPIVDVRMGTTLATNAVLERKGARCALIITRGFADLLRIGTQQRPDIFALRIEQAEPLYEYVIEVGARADASGSVLDNTNMKQLADELVGLLRNGITSLAVAVLNGHRAPMLEDQIGQLAIQLGFKHVALSHQVSPHLGLLNRASTTVLDAYLTPLITDYAERLSLSLPGSTLRFMQSSGGLVPSGLFRGPSAILSGPAGGVVGYAHVANAARVTPAIGFDMGGTSTDVSRYAGTFERRYETSIAGMPLTTPMLDVHTVAAGGGSLCRFDGQRLTVGPDSAGADPGPLCYGNPRARELTLTDINLFLGRIVAERFPFELDRERVTRELERICSIHHRDRVEFTPASLAEGFLRVANHSMARAIAAVSTERGYDVREHALVVFGGAGGQHACAVAGELGIERVVFHPLAGVLSAFGIGIADIRVSAEAPTHDARLSAVAVSGLTSIFENLEDALTARLVAEGPMTAAPQLLRSVELHYEGSETTLSLPFANAEVLEQDFTREHRKLFGYARRDHPVLLGQARVEAVVTTSAPRLAQSARDARVCRELRTTPLLVNGTWQDVPMLYREELPVAERLQGPLIILEATGTIVVETGYTCEVDAQGLLTLTHSIAPQSLACKAQARADGSALNVQLSSGPEVRPDPVLLEIFARRFMSIAEQMGRVLERTALSTNIRERLDFSCALFDAEGALVANAPHIPVHLGAMGESVLHVVRLHPKPQPGDVFATNDPILGGSHLPDITVVTPVFDVTGSLAFFVASRGHHADIGGITPGSMPAFSNTLSEEGIVLRAVKIVTRGTFERELLLQLLASGPYPARDPGQNLADLQAQVAANQFGVRLLAELGEQYDYAQIARYMQFVQDYAAFRVEEEIKKLGSGSYHFSDALDDGAPIVVTLTAAGGRLLIDFSGTAPQHPGNLNAPRAISVAAVIYFLRTLVGNDIPLNSGCLRPISLVLPEPSLLAPEPERAVAAGNVETSQRIIDVLFGALGKLAACQGTMNNISFGDERFGYYETIGGGAGAGPTFAGASGVHTHMTNTRITDAEVLESRFPVRIRSFALRKGSGGRGKFRGGDGIVREFEFLAPVTFTLLSERRVLAPFGLFGADSGARGMTFINGQEVAGKLTVNLVAGDRVRIETPGGGGFGAA